MTRNALQSIDNRRAPEIGSGADFQGASVQPRLTRREAAEYVGATEAGIRSAETKGLRTFKAENGTVWLDPADLDAWTWRKAQPSARVRSEVLRRAQADRSAEARFAELTERTVSREDTAPAFDYLAASRAGTALQAEASALNADERAAFLTAHVPINEATAEAFGNREAFRDALSRGLLAPVEAPRAWTVNLSMGAMPTRERGWLALTTGRYVRRDHFLELREQYARETVAREAAARETAQREERDGLSPVMLVLAGALALGSLRKAIR